MVTAFMSPTLPLELYRPIVEQVQQNGDVLNLRFVSRFMGSEAERKIYRHLIIRRESERSVFQQLAQSPRVCKLVRSLELLPGAVDSLDASYRRPSPDEEGRFWLAVHRSLCLMQHLERLVIKSSASQAPALESWEEICLLSGLSTATLRALTIVTISLDHMSYLESFKNLRELIILSSLNRPSVGEALDSDTFPCLTVLGCAASDVPYLLPGCPLVNRLYLTEGRPDSEWTSPWNGILALEFNLYISGDGLVQEVLDFFPELRYFKCSIFSDLDYMPFEPEYIASPGRTLPHLRKVYLHYQDTGKAIGHDFSCLFQAFPRLQSVVVQDRNESCREWPRDVVTVKGVPSWPEEWKDEMAVSQELESNCEKQLNVSFELGFPPAPRM